MLPFRTLDTDTLLSEAAALARPYQDDSGRVDILSLANAHGMRETLGGTVDVILEITGDGVDVFVPRNITAVKRRVIFADALALVALFLDEDLPAGTRVRFPDLAPVHQYLDVARCGLLMPTDSLRAAAEELDGAVERIALRFAVTPHLVEVSLTALDIDYIAF